MNLNRRKNIRVAAALVVVIVFMASLVAYSPTLYRLFCAATGYAGTTQRVEGDDSAVSDRVITVRFDTSIAPDLPWRFEPVQREVKVHLGEEKLVFFSAENLTDQPLVGHATFNVTPEKTGLYFKKIQCFCFDDERLDAHQKVDMPVDFFVDPALAKDSNAQDVSAITLSYTFFRTTETDKAKDLSRFVASAEPNRGRGQELFTERCAACHALERNKAGPMLGGVVGRKAGSAAGYAYSAALRGSGLIWATDNLDRWLSDPRGFVPGARMPVKTLDPIMRRDIIAYLQEEGRKPGTKPSATSLAQHAP
jgi:cytochrome c oxidase assembly protein subunit 11